MTWFKVDDEVPVHEKFAELCEGPCRGDAVALWTFAGCWSSRALKEGFVPSGVAKSFGFHADAATELVRVGLWEAAEGGFRFHDWADYQPSADQVEQRRKAGAERKARSRARLSGKLDDVHPTSPVGESRRDCVSVTGLPRTESRVCLADASRATGDLNSSSLSAENIQTFPDTSSAPAREPESHIVGFNFVASLLGRSTFDIPPLGSFVRQYTWIGGRPEAERAAVKLAVDADPWCRENPQFVDAKHLEGRWQRYLKGGPKTVVRVDARTQREQLEELRDRVKQAHITVNRMANAPWFDKESPHFPERERNAAAELAAANAALREATSAAKMAVAS